MRGQVDETRVRAKSPCEFVVNPPSMFLALSDARSRGACQRSVLSLFMTAPTHPPSRRLLALRLQTRRRHALEARLTRGGLSARPKMPLDSDSTVPSR